jgi:hypothetical protein
VARSVPAYYTYDQHWSAAGHVIAAEEIARAMVSKQEASTRASQ